MANIATNGSFENGSTGWTLSGDGAAVSTDSAYVGDYGLKLTSLRPITGIDPGSGEITYGDRYWGRASQTVATEAQQRYALSLFAKHVTGDNTNLLVDLANTVEANAVTVTPGEATDWARIYYQFDAASTATGLVVELEQYAENSGWSVDEVEVRKMPVQLAERAVDAVVSTLQDNLGTELTEIETEMADGLDLPEPAVSSYYKRPKSEIAGATSHVEVYESGFEIDRPYADAAAGRARFEVPLTVRLTHLNRSNASADEMMKRCRRYSAAIVRVLLEQHRLGGTDDSIRIAFPNGVTPYWEVDSEDEDIVRKIRIEVPVTVRCEEVND